MITHTILIPLVIIIERLYALYFAKIELKYHIRQYYLVNNFRNKSENAHVEKVGHVFLIGKGIPDEHHDFEEHQVAQEYIVRNARFS